MGSRLEANSDAVRKRIEQHKFDDEAGEEYGGSSFGGFSDYFRRKKIKLQNLDAERRRLNADKPQVFRGVVVHVNGYTQPSLNDLHAMIVDHGGGFLQYLDGKTMVTHVVASSLTPKKAVEFRRYRIVKPAWVVESIAAGKLLPWSEYRVLDEGQRQNVLSFQNGAVMSQASSQQRGYRDQSETSWYAAQVKDRARQADGQDSSERSASVSAIRHAGPSAGPDRHTNAADTLQETRREFDIPQSSLNSSFGLDGMDENDLLAAEDDDSRTIDESGLSDRQLIKQEPVTPQKYSAATRKPDLAGGQSPDKAAQEGATPSKKPLTAEEHNALLLLDLKIWKSTVVNPGFLKQYYEESRLHHLSTWKAELKSKLQLHAQEMSLSQKARQKRPAGARRYILHVDFDCFFVAVSLKKSPEYEGKPTVVAHGSGSGAEIASCNYHARKFGVKNGMWMKGALELCPNLNVLPYDFKGYEEASRQFYEAIMNGGGIVQSVSIDEALIDVSVQCIDAGGTDGKVVDDTGISWEQAKADEIAQGLRDEVKRLTGCAVSVGIGGSVLLAKLALRKAKPAGQYQVMPQDVLDFIGDLPVRDLPGVAWSLGRKLEELGAQTVKELRELTKERLMNALGPKTGQKLWEYARGIDRVEVGDQAIRKSVSAEVNWGVRFVTQEQVDDFVRSLCQELYNRLLNEGVKGQQLTMKVMKRAADAGLDPPKHLGHGKCDVFNKSIMLGAATNDPALFSREAISTLNGFGFSPGELRGIGLQMTKLEPINKGPLPGGQRRLQFRTTDKEPAAEDVENSDVIETPKKPDRFFKHEAATLVGVSGPSGSKPLNTFGSQFVLPSQVDPAVLAELPQDIRSKLMKEVKPAPGRDPNQNTLEFTSQSVTSTRNLIPPPVAEIPSAFELDPETLAALPEDMRAEVLAFYEPQNQAQHRQSPQHSRQVRLPQSPHANRAVRQPLKRLTPTKRGRGRPRGSRTAAPVSRSGPLQSNFVPVSAVQPFEGEVSEEFLAALPEDLREEVLAQTRSSRLQARAGLSVPEQPRPRSEQANDVVQRIVEVKARPPKPTFTARGLSSLPELREAVDAWVEAMEEDGPEERDVQALEKYLERVVVEEQDMPKAVQVVKWLEWVVSAHEWTDSGEVQQEWSSAVDGVKQAVSKAVVGRGLPPPQF